jgi:hypothetical protein
MPGRRAFIAKRRDKTEAAIFNALIKAGADVIRLDTFDLIVLYRGRVFLLECKSIRGKKVQTMREKTRIQVGLVNRGWPLSFVTTPEQALQAIGALSCDGPAQLVACEQGGQS